MRIISGDFRGKKINQPKDIKTRPLKDLTKESIFNIISHSNKININLKNSNVLDLFSGVGSFGIECLSRGARYVTFVENYNGVLNILKKNLINLKDVDNYGASRLIYTDINRDGMKQSPNFEETAKVADTSNCPVIISGGVSSIDDIKKAKELNNKNIEGIIIGKAIYDGDIKLEELVKELDA